MKGSKMKSISKITVILFVSIMLALNAFAAMQVKSAKLLPPETVFMVNVENFSQLESQFKKTNIYQLYEEPAMKDFFNDLQSKWTKKIEQMDKNNIFKTLLDSDVRPTGKATVAIVLNKQSMEEEPGMLFVTEWGSNIDKIKDAMAKMVKENANYGGHQEAAEDYRGVSIEKLVDEGGQSFNYCFIDDAFLGSTDGELLKFSISHLQGASSPSLGDDSDYTSSLRAVGPYEDLSMFVNIKQILKAAVADGAKAESGQNQAEVIINNLGFDNVAFFTASAGFARRPGSSCNTKALLKVNGEKKGVCKMLDFESIPVKAPEFVPASYYAVTFLNINIKKAHAELANILGKFNPMQASMLYMPLIPPSPDGQPGVMLKDDVIDHLGSQIIIAQNVNAAAVSADAIGEPEYLLAIAVNDRAALERSLGRLHSTYIAANDPDSKRELLGYTLYKINPMMLPFFGGGRTPMQAPPAGAGAGQMPVMAFTITDSYFIFGLESSVEQAVRTLSSSEQPSLSSAKWFNEAKLNIPSIAGLAGLEDTATASKIAWEMIKKSAAAEGTSQDPNMPMTGPFPPFFDEFFNIKLLPPFESVEKYFGSSTSYGISRPDGFFLEGNYLNPVGAK